MIEEVEERFTEDDIAKILETVMMILPSNDDLMDADKH